MLYKSLIVLSIIFNIIGLESFSDRFDRALYRMETGETYSARASNLDLELPKLTLRPRITKDAEPLLVSANHYILGDMKSGAIVAERAAYEPVPIASTTKIMTAMVVLDNFDLDEVVTVSAAAASQIGADTYLRVGERITVYELLHCLLIRSGNDSAYAFAEHANEQGEVGIAKFVDMMNDKAHLLGLDNTRYEDPAGLNTEGFSTAYDLFSLTRHALQNDVFAEIVKKDRYVATNLDGDIYHELKNSNRLVGEYQYPGALGVKTGYMPDAGHCLVSAAEREGHTLIGVVLKTYADTAPASADESRVLLDWGFDNLRW